MSQPRKRWQPVPGFEIIRDAAGKPIRYSSTTPQARKSARKPTAAPTAIKPTAPGRLYGSTEPETATRQRYPVSMRSATSSKPLRLPPSARDNMFELAQQSIDGLETGGAMFGERNFREITASQIGGPGGAIRTSDSFVRDAQHDIILGRDLKRAYGIDEVGCWHVHPIGGLGLSDGDQQHAAAMLTCLRREEMAFTYTMVVLAPGGTYGDDWRNLRIGAWTIRHGNRETAITGHTPSLGDWFVIERTEVL